MLEYPIKTLNFLPGRQRFQVDTGPLLFVDLASDLPEPIDWLCLAHIAFNRFQRAEFAKLGHAPVERDGRVVCEVEGYTHIHAQDARHRLYVAVTSEPS